MTDKSIQIKGKIGYHDIFVPGQMFGKYRVDVLLDAEGVAAAKKANLRVKVLENYKNLYEGFDGSYIRAEAAPKSAAGKDNNPPRIYDAKAKRLEKQIGVGYGSDVLLKATLKTMDFLSKKELSPAEAMKKWGGYGLLFNALQILNLVEYTGNQDFVPSEEGSFSVSNTEGGFNFDEGDEIPEFDKAS